MMVISLRTLQMKLTACPKKREAGSQKKKKKEKLSTRHRLARMIWYANTFFYHGHGAPFEFPKSHQ
jgi:hypothetical protein